MHRAKLLERRAGVAAVARPAQRLVIAPGLLALMVAVILFCSPSRARTETIPPQGESTTRSGMPLPLEIKSSSSSAQAAGEVSGVLAMDYIAVQQALADPAAWCDFITLHINVKACVYAHRDGAIYLRTFGGTKEFESVKSAREIEWTFTVVKRTAAHTEIVLRAKDGPMGTFNYFMGVNLAPTGAAATALHLVYRYELGLTARIAVAGYLKTVARAKVGFSVIDSTARGAARYVGGVRGMTERNVVRYYLALLAYFDSVANGPFVSADAARRWFDLTADYPTQLEEVPRADYLDAKRREYEQQRTLQEALDAG